MRRICIQNDWLNSCSHLCRCVSFLLSASGREGRGKSVCGGGTGFLLSGSSTDPKGPGGQKWKFKLHLCLERRTARVKNASLRSNIFLPSFPAYEITMDFFLGCGFSYLMPNIFCLSWIPFKHRHLKWRWVALVIKVSMCVFSLWMMYIDCEGMWWDPVFAITKL